MLKRVAVKLRLPVVVLAAALASMLLMGGCATLPPPTDALGSAQEQISRAEAAGAKNYAPESLGQAQAAIGQARILSESGDNFSARYSAELAYSYAELALAQAQAERADAKADSAENELERTRRNSGVPEQ